MNSTAVDRCDDSSTSARHTSPNAPAPSLPVSVTHDRGTSRGTRADAPCSASSSPPATSRSTSALKSSARRFASASRRLTVSAASAASSSTVTRTAVTAPVSPLEPCVLAQRRSEVGVGPATSTAVAASHAAATALHVADVWFASSMYPVAPSHPEHWRSL